MQQPTCTNIRIRSTHDAHVIFYAVQRKLLHMVTRRLDADERLALKTGCVYAWEERGPHTEITGLGIERFTEGRRWSPSRVRDEFLFYYEKYSPPADAAQSGTDRQPPRDWDPLVKQTYSVWVETEKGRRKWHLTAYFTQATVDQLGTIDDLDGVRGLIVPDGIFKSTRLGKNRGKTDDQHAGRNDSSKSATTVSRTYAAFPSPYPSSSQAGSPSASQPVSLFEPYQKPTYSGYTPTETPSPHFSTTPPLPPSQRSLPPLLDPYQPNSERHNQSIPSPSQTYSDYMRPTVPNRTLEPIYNSPQAPSSYSSTLPAANESHYHPASPNYASSYSQQQSASASSWYAAPSQNYSDHASSASTTQVSATASYATGHSYHSVPPMSSHSLASTSNNLQVYPPSSTHHQQQRHYPRPQSPHTSTSHTHNNRLLLHSGLPPGSTLPSLSTTSQGNSPPLTTRRSSPPAAFSSSSADIRRPPLPSITIPNNMAASYELSAVQEVFDSDRNGSIGPCRDLAPLAALTRGHPYRRDPLDDKTLRSFQRPS
ncbi:hypothetical protein BDN72DRAFT_896320 [Pluteus cervinus]|uniref:Uncharacterized protein n=1 Tax=Pluteus cervinus TaxID=181527 RepID=A0ACD3AYF0_9AGAR|nr:hypothetical protein BDN72DRAFT_896320 [Pluteus cervinus]